MPILYSLISRGPTILCSNQVGGGNYEQVVKKILPNIPTRSDARTTYTSDNYLFHVDVDNGMVYMCMSGPDDGKSVPYGFLTQIKQDFASQGLVSRAHFAEEMELQSQFKPTLQTQMEKFSSGSAQGASGGNQQLSKLQSQVDEVRDVMTQNIEKVLERGENLSDLEAKTEDLEYHAGTFQKTARKVHRKMWWKNTKMMLILACVVTTVVVVIILIILFSTGTIGSGGGSSSTTTPAAISDGTSNGSTKSP